MKETKKNKGITLIALVITIIVMLILVAVTITMAINGGLFNYAGKAVGDTQNALNKEQQLANGEISINGVIYNSIDDYIKDEPSEKTTLMALYKTGKLKVGDYVNYRPDIVSEVNPDGTGSAAGTLTGYVDEPQSIKQKKDLKWRVLGAEGDNLLLISATPTDDLLKFSGALGYNNYENVLKTVCGELYSNEKLGATARSITMQDIDKYLGGSAFIKSGFDELGKYNETQNFTNVYTPDNMSGTYTGPLTSNAYFYEANSVISDEIKLELLLGTNIDHGTFHYGVASVGQYVFNGGALWLPASVGDGKVGYLPVFRSSSLMLWTSEGDYAESANTLRPIVVIPSELELGDVSIDHDARPNSWKSPFIPA